MLSAGCTVARRLHRPADAEDERLLPNAVIGVRERVTVLAEWMKRMGRPLSRPAERIVAKVHAELALGDGAPVVCHGDLNPANLLSAHREPWLAIDPLPLVAPAAYDAVSLVWSKRPWLLEQPDPAGALNLRVELASDALGVSEGHVWAWTLARAAILIDRFAWGGYNEALFIRVVERSVRARQRRRRVCPTRGPGGFR